MHTLDTQRKDRLQLNYGQIEPWERRSSKAELELNAEAVSLSHTNTHAYAFQTAEHLIHKHLLLTHTLGMPPRQNISNMYLTLCLLHTHSDGIASFVQGFSKAGRQMKRDSNNVSVHFFPLCKCVFVDAFGHQNFWIRGRIFVCICEWERVCVCVGAFILITDCGIPPPHWHLCMHPLPPLRETGAKEAVKSEGMPSQSNKIPPCQATSAVEKQEMWHNNQSNIEGSWRQNSGRGRRNGIHRGGVRGTVE